MDLGGGEMELETGVINSDGKKEKEKIFEQKRDYIDIKLFQFHLFIFWFFKVLFMCI